MKLSARGFTLIELLIAIAILGVLASVIIINFIGPQRDARDSKRRSDIRQYQTGLEIFANENNGFYPTRRNSQGVRASTVLCGDLGLSVCEEDPTYPSPAWRYYYYQSYPGTNGNVQATRYVLWTFLEKTEDVFVVCSNGKVGEAPRAGFIVNLANCPI